MPLFVFCGFCTIGFYVLVYFSDFTYPYRLRQGFRVDICVLFIYLQPKYAAPWLTILYLPCLNRYVVKAYIFEGMARSL